MSYLDELNDIQRKAVTTIDGPVLVVAGPGSGKTRVLTYRIAHLIKSGVPPYKILSLTFTNKAAREMKERISKVVGDKANQVWAGTFHSIFARILRVEASKIGYPSNFTIYDRQDSESVVKAILKEQHLDPKVYNPRNILGRISSAKSSLITPKAYAADEQLRLQDRAAKMPHLHAIYAGYVVRCKKAGAMDFDDLLYQMFYLLYKNPDGVLEKYQKKFSHLLVDEFQDTNFLQYAIIKKFVNYKNSPKNVCAVGDDAQSIYAFRGATIQNILDFEKDYKGLQTFKLEQNYRSTDHIVQAANNIIKHNKRQIQKKIWSDKGEGQKIKLLQAPTDNDEGKQVASMIVEQKNRYHLHNKDIAILYRTNSQSRIFEEYLRRHNIPYKVFGGLSFYQRKEIKDMIAYLRVLVNPSDEEALKRVINYPKRGIGKTTIDKLAARAAQANTRLWDELLMFKGSPRAAKAIGSFVKIIVSTQKKLDEKDAYEVAAEIARKSGILDTLKNDKTIEGSNRLENFTSLLDGIKDFVENDEVIDEATIPDKKLGTYLQNIALHTDLDEQKSDDVVTLMSVHSSKGLEFPSVFVVGMEDNLFPSFMSIDSADGMDEERRLFYVAVTRAELFLTLSYAKSRYRFGKHQNNNPSPFLDEVGYEHIEQMGGLSSRRSTSGVSFSKNTLSRFRKPESTSASDIPDFRPVPAARIKTGMKVLHKRFGRGQVKSIEGSDNRVATIVFNEIGEKRIMLKFAKLGIDEA
ncbi:MAG: ATP-dependent helicase [Saprospiraceae bacterium]